MSLLARIGAAQTLTGGLFSTVHDEQGLPIAGAQIRLSSPSLLSGPMTGTTSERGMVRFPALPAGAYDVEVSMAAFALSRAMDVHIGTAIVYQDIVLKLASLSDAVTVTGSASDIRNPGFSTPIDSDLLATTPTRRNGVFAFIGMAPGISSTSQASVFVSAFGSGVDQNSFLVDGTNVTATSNGTARSEPGIDFVQEMHVQSVGASAEYGNVQGAVIETITRQGGVVSNEPREDFIALDDALKARRRSTSERAACRAAVLWWIERGGNGVGAQRVARHGDEATGGSRRPGCRVRCAANLSDGHRSPSSDVSPLSAVPADR